MDKKAIALAIYRAGCIRFGEFKLSSGATSPIYIDMRTLPSNPKEFKTIIEASLDVLKGSDFDLICGVATGGLIYASVIAYLLSKPLIYVRKKVKEHGTSRILEGDFSAGSRVLVIDDVSTTGLTLLTACRVLTESELNISSIFVLVDRGQGACELLNKHGFNFTYLIKLSDLLTFLLNEGILDNALYEEIVKSLWG